MSAVEERVREAPRGDGAMIDRVHRVQQHLIDQAERRVRDVKRLARKGQFALEDGVDEVALQVRRRPGTSLAVAFAVGTLAGAVVAFSLRRRRTVA